MNANVIFTNEFKQMTKQKLPKAQRKELRIKALKEAEENGKFINAKSRYDIAKLAGFTDAQRASGYIWVLDQIKAGVLKEHIVGYKNNGRAEYEYHMANSKPVVKPVEAPMTIAPTFKPEVKVINVAEPKPVAVTIKADDVTISIENAGVDYIIALLKGIKEFHHE